MIVNSTYKQELKDFLVISALSPALGLWRLFKAKNEKFIIIGSMLMMGIFGALFAYPEGSDGHSHYLHSLEYYTSMNFPEFWLESWNIIMQNPSFGITDLYIHFLSFISNSTLGIPKSLHFFAGLVLGYFIAKSLLLVLGENIQNLTWKSGLWIFIILLLVHTVNSLNAIRIGTGAWVLFYGATGFYFTKNWKYLLLIILAIQIHLAMAVIAIPVVLAFILTNRKWLTVGIWGMSFFIQLSFIDFSAALPETEVVDTKTHYYVLDDQALKDFKIYKSTSDSNWYATLGPKLYFNVALIIAIGGMLLIYVKNRDPRFSFMFSAALLLYAFANVISFIPSLQGRLINNVSIFLLFAILYQLQQSSSFIINSMRYRIFIFSIFIFSILSIPFLMKSSSQILSTTEAFFLLFPFASLAGYSFSIRDLIGDIL